MSWTGAAGAPYSSMGAVASGGEEESVRMGPAGAPYSSMGAVMLLIKRGPKY